MHKMNSAVAAHTHPYNLIANTFLSLNFIKKRLYLVALIQHYTFGKTLDFVIAFSGTKQ